MANKGPADKVGGRPTEDWLDKIGFTRALPPEPDPDPFDGVRDEDEDEGDEPEVRDAAEPDHDLDRLEAIESRLDEIESALIEIAKRRFPYVRVALLMILVHWFWSLW